LCPASSFTSPSTQVSVRLFNELKYSYTLETLHDKHPPYAKGPISLVTDFMGRVYIVIVTQKDNKDNHSHKDNQPEACCRDKGSEELSLGDSYVSKQIVYRYGRYRHVLSISRIATSNYMRLVTSEYNLQQGTCCASRPSPECLGRQDGEPCKTERKLKCHQASIGI
jgi:hypothetical protein